MRNIYIAFMAITLTLSSCAQNPDSLNSRIDATLNLASQQYEYMKTRLPEGRYPKTYYADRDKFETSNSDWWCSGFYPGTLLYLNEVLNKPVLKQEIDRVLMGLKKEQFNKSTHDLGFMMYCSFGNANRLNPKSEYKEILMNSAKSLATRYNDTVKSIRSWDSASWNKAGEDDLVVIIDNMMNLELLFWAARNSKDSTYYDIAINHADKTIENQFRKDYSSYHEVIYDEKTGDVKAQITNQGASDESAWARGQAWGLYGFVVTYRETKDLKYLEQANAIAEFILNHPNMPKDMVPYWDFDANNIPDALRDSSAAAIIASALLELKTYVNQDLENKYENASETILSTLLTDEYLAEENTNGGFLLKRGVGNMPNKTEIDTPLSYGDYYLVEAMIRYKNL
ncbi:glycoside hydrolase family 88 protein [Mariniflexile litorale]|uniref:Glycoside hydrolase family 88 protein n=1 Tax=Mariniflexile litorale TaxID=3045158 RepID=A0AAU7EJ18_9FLAO|nr:glycoside hydrolase family 88 protein [Mariniflexile sp. KMM 9835]MDQ8210686.1 glycoside hydrolase family 88 protein [Mariniflexile sp. KMM 9835]